MADRPSSALGSSGAWCCGPPGRPPCHAPSSFLIALRGPGPHHGTHRKTLITCENRRLQHCHWRFLGPFQSFDASYRLTSSARVIPGTHRGAKRHPRTGPGSIRGQRSPIGARVTAPVGYIRRYPGKEPHATSAITTKNDTEINQGPTSAPSLLRYRPWPRITGKKGMFHVPSSRHAAGGSDRPAVHRRPVRVPRRGQHGVRHGRQFQCQRPAFRAGLPPRGAL